MPASSRVYLLLAAILGLLGVALGAFGAHGLGDTLASRGSTRTWETAVLYHLVHAVALLALALGGDRAGLRVGAIGACWVTGVLFFSGSLYLLALGGPRMLGPITPLGGLAFLAGWLLVAAGAWKPRQP